MDFSRFVLPAALAALLALIATVIKSAETKPAAAGVNLVAQPVAPVTSNSGPARPDPVAPAGDAKATLLPEVFAFHVERGFLSVAYPLPVTSRDFLVADVASPESLAQALKRLPPPRLIDTQYTPAGGKPFALDPAALFRLSYEYRGTSLFVAVAGEAAKIAPGSYKLQFLLSRGDEAASAETRLATLTVERPDFALSLIPADGKINVWSNYSRFWSNENSSQPAIFSLRESARKTGATDLSVADFRDEASTRESNAGHLVLRPVSPYAKPSFDLFLDQTFQPLTVEDRFPLVIPAGATQAFRVELAGQFPVGVTKGKIVFHTPYTEPLSIAYTVTRRLTPALIFVIAIVGAFAGWYVRIRLREDRERLLARAAVAQIATDLATAAQVGDETYHDKIQRLQAKLEAAEDAASSKSTSATVSATLDLIRNDLTKADAALTESLGKIGDRLAPIRRLLVARWDLPPAVKLVPGPLHEVMNEIAPLWERGELSQVVSLYDGPLQLAMHRLAEDSFSWREQCGHYFDQFVAETPTLAAGGVEKLRTAVAEWKSMFARPRIVQPMVTSSELKAELLLAHRALHQARLIVSSLRQGALEMANWADSQLPAAPEMAEVQRRLYRKIGDDYEACLGEIEEPTAALRNPPSRGEDHLAAWQELLRTAVRFCPGAPADIAAKINALAIPVADWGAALEPLVGALRSATSSSVQPAPLARAIPSAVTAESTVAPAVDPADSPETSFLSRPFLPNRTTSPVGEQRRLLGLAASTEAVQTGCVAFVYIVAAYALLGDTWTGTTKEIFNLFAWAFVFDLTVSGVTTALQRIRPTALP